MTTLEWIMLIFGYMSKLLPLPTWGVIESFRAWLLDKLIPVLKEITLQTPTPLDDAGVGILESIVNNDTLFTLLYNLIFSEHKVGVDNTNVIALAEATDSKPESILTIISLLIAILKALGILKKE